MVIGICGKSGSGKTAICNVLRKKNILVIDADNVSREIVDADQDDKIKTAFPSCYNKNVLDRKKLASLVFSDKSELELLNSITHPQIKSRIMQIINDNHQFEHIVVDAPVLIEAGMKDMFDCTVCVTTDDSIRIKRIIDRDGLDKSQADARLSAQKPDDFYISNTDFYVVNNGSVTLEELADSIIERSCIIADK